MELKSGDAAVPDEFVVTRRLKEVVLAALLDRKSEAGVVSASQVRDAAVVLNCSERTVWRWVRRGEVASGRHGEVWESSDDLMERLLTCGGSIAALHRELASEGEAPVSVRTMQRAFAREQPAVLLTFARHGFKAAKAQLPTSAMPDVGVNDEWSMDDTQLPVWCVLPGGEVGKAQLQGIMDACTRYVLSWHFSPFTLVTEDGVTNIAHAIQGHHTPNGVFVGGKPRCLRSDRGSAFVTEAITRGLLDVGVTRKFSEPYKPEQNGKIERWHQTVKQSLRKLPGYDWSTHEQKDPRKPVQAPHPRDLLTYEELIVEVSKVITSYNSDHVHTAHGLTPEACWEREVAEWPDAIRRGDGRAIRAAMRQTKSRTLSRRRIRWDNRWYNLHPQSVDGDDDPKMVDRRRKLIDATEGRRVTVTYLPNAPEYVSVYDSRGDYLGDAVWDAVQTAEQAAETNQARRKHSATMNSLLERRAEAGALAVASRRELALAEAAADGLDYSAYDDPDEGPARPSPGAPGDPFTNRSSRTSKKSPAAATAHAAASRRAKAEQRRRDDAAEAAAWVRPTKPPR